MKNTSRPLPVSAQVAAERDTLVRDNLSLVHFVAKRLGRSLSADLDADEMVNIGTLGLMSAIESFDPSRGLAFSTYAVPRIRGAILDDLRRQDHVPRSVRRKSRDVSTAREVLMCTLGRAPTGHEVAFALGIDVATLWRWQTDIEHSVQVPLHGPEGDRDEIQASPLDFLSAPGMSADEHLLQEERVRALRDAILLLKPQQRMVLSLYYFEGLNARQIAQVLEISESRVSQIRSKSLVALRRILEPLRISA